MWLWLLVRLLGYHCLEGLDLDLGQPGGGGELVELAGEGGLDQVAAMREGGDEELVLGCSLTCARAPYTPSAARGPW